LVPWPTVKSLKLEFFTVSIKLIAALLSVRNFSFRLKVDYVDHEKQKQGCLRFSSFPRLVQVAHIRMMPP